MSKLLAQGTDKWLVSTENDLYVIYSKMVIRCPKSPGAVIKQGYWYPPEPTDKLMAELDALIAEFEKGGKDAAPRANV